MRTTTTTADGAPGPNNDDDDDADDADGDAGNDDWNVDDAAAEIMTPLLRFAALSCGVERAKGN